ncbi:putative phage abortive infection protein [Domibacillus aminovorans]|uniref:Phage abortive infection protein n=1 Tax=Domibacillus aminovorans TaxID=29332 RepID=A0A177L8R9_9BACI|nr:putative phage abortive infection protein [Domibacillus aminovorans]OAH61973.1 hypothetical protein AWH49_11165 [Domibacillus aminovorans]
MDDNKELQDKDVRKIWLYAGFGAIFSAIAMPIIIFVSSGESASIATFKSLGAVGDFFGGSTIGFLSLASIFFVIHAIRIQSQELAFQREELRMTNEELEKTRLQHELSNQTLIKQQFDSTFFKMIDLHNSIVKEMEYRQKSSRSAFMFFWNYFVGEVRRDIFKKYDNGDGVINGQKVERNIFLENYRNEQSVNAFVTSFLSEHEYLLGHYFRNMYRIIKFIEESQLSKEEKRNYRGIFRAQLSTYELYLLFYNVNYYDDGQNFRELIRGKNFFDQHIDGLFEQNVVLAALNKQVYQDLN